MESSKMYCPSRCRYRTDQLGARNYPVSREVVQGPELKYAKLRPYQSPWYRVCTKAMVISKGSYGHGEFKNALPQSVQIPYLPLRGSKVPRFMGCSIGPRMEICETSALPIPMVSRLHQSNGYIKRKLWAWRVQKCIALVGADTVLTSWGPANYPVSREVVQGTEWKYAKLRSYQSPWYSVCIKAMAISKGSYGHGEFKNVLPQSVQIPYLPLRGSKVPRFMGGSKGPRMEICEISALPIPMVRRLHQSNGYIKRKLRAWRVQKCIALVGADTVLTTVWKQSTPFHGGQYRALNGNMRNFGPTNPHGTAFAPKQWLYQKEATGMESSKMYYHSWCRYRTYHCVAAKYPVSWGVVQGPEWKYAKLRPYQSPWYRVCTKAMVISKGSYGHGEFENALPQSVLIPY